MLFKNFVFFFVFGYDSFIIFSNFNIQIYIYIHKLQLFSINSSKYEIFVCTEYIFIRYDYLILYSIIIKNNYTQQDDAQHDDTQLKTGGQWYSDTFPFSIPWMLHLHFMHGLWKS